MISALYCSSIVAICIMSAKIYGFFMTGSMSLLASLVDSSLDIFSSLINLLAMRLSMQPPDNKHRFGKDKVEDLAIFGQSIFFFASGLFTMVASARLLLEPRLVESSDVGIKVMVFSLICTALLIFYQTIVISKTQSRLVIADKLHYFVDFLTNGAVILSLHFSQSIPSIDAIFGILIAFYIIWSAYGLFLQASKNLIDQEFSEVEKNKIIKLLTSYNKDVFAVHELKTRYAGSKPFIQFHLEMRSDMSLLEAHAISDNITAELEKLFVGAEITIHQDPAGLEDNAQYREILNSNISVNEK
ncbi:MAG: cation diffusion facilitator family transporter [Pseudomonadota bacterium]